LAASGREATNMATENNDVSSGDDAGLSQDETKTRKARLHAQRMRLHRRRRRSGMRSVHILLSTSQVDSLVRDRHLDDPSRNDQVAIEDAVEQWGNDTLFVP
jgi:hypothetical protein